TGATGKFAISATVAEIYSYARVGRLRKAKVKIGNPSALPATESKNPKKGARGDKRQKCQLTVTPVLPKIILNSKF
ncbi:MAG: hypothetical protein IIW89_02595, partial [Alistipes sp.]|nr:hypothetical protein [Alistipes sp.]